MSVPGTFARAALGALLAVTVVGLPALGDGRRPRGVPPSEPSLGPAVAATRPPVLFIANRGQAHPRVDLYAPLRDGALYLGRDGLTRLLVRDGTAWAVRQTFAGARPDLRFEMESEARTRFHFHRGGPRGSTTDVPSTTLARCRDLLPGVDLVVEARPGAVEYSLRAAPGADVAAPTVAWAGATSVRRTERGTVEIATPAGSWEESAPRAWQELPAGGRREVAAAWGVPVRSADLSFRAPFLLGPVDPSLPLVIDPAFPAYSGYVGGAGSEGVLGVAAAADGSAVVVGGTTSPQDTFPVKVGPQAVFAGALDGFAARVSADGAGLAWCGYVGGAGFDEATCVALAADGSVVLGGRTTSDGETFPFVVGPFAVNAGNQDVFLARIAANGATLLSSGFLGGAGSDLCHALALDATGNIVLAGETYSSAATFPVLTGPGLIHRGGPDAFVAKIASTADAVLWCGYLGGTGDDRAWGVAVAPVSGRILVGGGTTSAAASFPVVGGVGPVASGGEDGFVAAVAADGTGLAWSGFVGGSAADRVRAVAAGGDDSLHFAGWSDSEDVAVTGVPDLTHNGGRDALVGRVSAGGALAALGYVGGSGDDEVGGIAVDAAGGVLIAGTTTSDASTFPERGGPGLAHGGFRDAFVGGLKAAGRGWAYLGYLGGAGLETAQCIALDPVNGQPVVGGTGESLPSPTGPGTEYSGSVDAIVARFDPSAYTHVATAVLEVAKGVLKDSTKEGKDAFNARGSITLGAEAGDAPFDPAGDDLSFWFGDGEAPVALQIGAGDAGWKVKGTKLQWKSPKKTFPILNLVLDPGRGTWSFKATRLQFGAPPGGEVGITLQGGRIDTDRDATWTEKKPGVLKAP